MSQVTEQVVERLYEGGLIREKVRYIEGAVTTEDELTFDQNGDESLAPVTRWRGTRYLETRVFEYEA